MIDRELGCPLCEATGELLIWSDTDWRVIRVEDLCYPGFYRLISNAHVSEFSDLLVEARHRCIDLACAIERAVIEQLQPTKMNFATLGNAVPHLHFHVVARFDWDGRFPEPIWGAALREVEPSATSRLRVSPAHLDDHVRAALLAIA